VKPRTLKRHASISAAIVVAIAVIAVASSCALSPRFAAPSSLTAEAGYFRSILKWTNNSEPDEVLIRCKTTGYPTDPIDGNLVYQGSGTKYTHGNLDYGETYYYSIWSVRITKGVQHFSKSAASASAKPDWMGANRETLHESVNFKGAIVVGADGHQIALDNNPKARDVTWAELQQFLLDDQTNEIHYSDDVFVCADFAERLHNNAEEAGITAAYVSIDFGPEDIYSLPDWSTGCPSYHGGRHACNAFQTTDKGLIFVDDTGAEDGSGEDCTVLIVEGHLYTPVSMFSDDEWCPMGQVVSFQVMW
jgi:hypothetical protein